MEKIKIPFNKPSIVGKELENINQSVLSGKISGNGLYTKKCQAFFQESYGFNKTLLTTSCTDALEMSAILSNISPGDEVIVPSYTFVSSAIAFIRQGAKIVFADSKVDHPKIDEDKLEELITAKTKAIVVVHYAGMACAMDKIMQIATEHNLIVVEDAAQAINNYFVDVQGDKHALGGIGHFGAFSFHETKNIIAGEGGLLILNDEKYNERAEIIWEKGTDRAKFFRGEIDKYGWVDTGSSFLPSEIIAAFLEAQLQRLNEIQTKRISIWNSYYENLKNLRSKEKIYYPDIPKHSTLNGHMFFFVCRSLNERNKLLSYLKEAGIYATFHYQSLHKSTYYQKLYEGQSLPNSDKYTNQLIRLPLFFELSEKEIDYILLKIHDFYS